MRRNVLLVAIFLALLAIAASAASVTILKISNADSAGFFLKPYYENRNAPVTGCTAPCLTVDTQLTEPNPTSGTLTLDGSTTGTWSSGLSFTISATTANANDVIMLWVVTYMSGSSITVSSVGDSLNQITWMGSARTTYTACTGVQETTQTEWYGIASSKFTSDVITVTLSGTPTLASGEEFAVTGANTASPFDPNANVPKSAVSTCSAAGAAPTVSGLSTTNPNDFIFALYGGYTSTTETAGAITGNPSTLMKTVAGTGDSLAAEYRVVAATQSAVSCAFGTSATYWGILCDAIVQAAGSFSLPAGSNMYLWSPQFSSATSIAPGALSFQLFVDLPAPALDGKASGTWTSGKSFTITPFTAANANDVVILSIVTYASGSSITVTSILDSTAKISWHSPARSSSVSCSGAQEATEVELYGIAATADATDTITVLLSATPTAASGIAFGVSGADTATPFDPISGLPKTGVSGCGNVSTAPTVSGVSTAEDNDFVFSLFGAYTSVTETAGSIGTTVATLVSTVAGVGDSNGVEYRTGVASQSSASCTFGTATSYWGALCDALMPARQTITVSYVTTNAAGAVQSTMISGSVATITAFYAPVSLPSSAGTIPASGYVSVIITAPAGAALTVYWGYPKLTQFQVSLHLQDVIFLISTLVNHR